MGHAKRRRGRAEEGYEWSRLPSFLPSLLRIRGMLAMHHRPTGGLPHPKALSITSNQTPCTLWKSSLDQLRCLMRDANECWSSLWTSGSMKQRPKLNEGPYAVTCTNQRLPMPLPLSRGGSRDSLPSSARPVIWATSALGHVALTRYIRLSTDTEDGSFILLRTVHMRLVCCFHPPTALCLLGSTRKVPSQDETY